MFDGFGTMVLGVLLSGLINAGVTWKIVSMKIDQRQKAGDNARQIQVGGNQKIGLPDD